MKANSKSIVVYPTDTVWGIGGSIHSLDVHHSIMAIKQSSTARPVSILFADLDMLHDYLDIPTLFDRDWLSGFFSLETTLCLSRSRMRHIPDWVVADSAYVGVRCLDRPWIRQMIDEVGTPVTTTSLNLKGDAPILTLDKARSFCAEWIPDAIVFADASPLSGRASSVVVVDHETNACRFLREGARADEIKRHVERLAVSR